MKTPVTDNCYDTRLPLEKPAPVRLLLIEDDVRLASLVRDYLQQEDFIITVQHSGDAAVESFDATAVDIVVLDLMLPGMNGLEVCTRLRRSYQGPILILTAKSGDIDHVMGLELGADDFVTKPIEPPVLLARLRALLRRTRPAQVTSTEEYVFGNLRVNLQSHQVVLDGKEVDLTTQEFELLGVLVRHAGSVVSRDTIYSNIRGIEYDGMDRTVDVRISRLRKKLNDNSEQPYRIRTIWGKGYLFVVNAWS
ncbi:MAG: winged helix-turn-helix domain-containing protein [Gammaproteobacteria bacterium]|nr:winged helix-turn-helix domain-containing protein [Gammaproteobacteria bacterium]MDP2141246.1 winged helix-turn-helix domain-containing protein [Gammaproteobacteria bacterium]MDP2349080.1 winged helix-turn-helix domain-containing protein [Gammaproteobacteria bacterium]